MRVAGWPIVLTWFVAAGAILLLNGGWPRLSDLLAPWQYSVLFRVALIWVGLIWARAICRLLEGC